MHTAMRSTVMIAGASVVKADLPAQRFQIDAHLVSEQVPQTGDGLALNAVASASRSSPAGGGYSLSASAIARRYECASDTIFVDGFDL